MNTISSPAMVKNRVRDPRLDFFRGIGMFIIFMAHMPGNYYTLWIPARFGFSDATEIFVFCSGMASAIAFGKIFSDAGWLMGAARILHRAWQVYWAHIGLFFVVAGMLAAIDATELFSKTYINTLNLAPFFKNTGQNLVGLLTLTYVPNLFDILPMYIGILMMIPVVMALRKVHLLAVAMFVALVWIGAQLSLLQFPAEPWSQREWFFNPFGWQLVFFTGFAFMSGWLPPPPIKKTWIATAIAIILLTVPFAYFRLLNAYPDLRELRGFVAPYRKEDVHYLYQYILHYGKTDFGLLRYIHFLAIAYLAWIIAGPKGKNLTFGRYGEFLVRIIHKVGQQALATFMSGLVVARFLGFVLDQVGRDWVTVSIANLTGFACMIGVAYMVSWYKKTPWKNPVRTKFMVEPVNQPRTEEKNPAHRETAV